MADVRSEGIDIVDLLAQRLAHVGDRAGEQTDLVIPLWELRHVDFARAAQAHPMRGNGEAPQRPRDRTRQEHRKQHGDGDENTHRADDERPLVTNRLGEGAVIVGREEDSAFERHRR